ncbi:MAG TPA: VOC family protein [Thermomicrobiales bacterium]|nr:VOC family protein [Thermomicrobiales bacterium]
MHQQERQTELTIAFEHIGVVVRDLDEAACFFASLGFRLQDRFDVGGSWVDRIIGLTDVEVEGMFVTAPDGSGALELVKFHAPQRSGDPVDLPANALGIRHIAYRVSDIETMVARASAAGYGLVGEVVNYQDIFLLAYIRGPEGLIVEVAQPLESN